MQRQCTLHTGNICEYRPYICTEERASRFHSARCLRATVSPNISDDVTANIDENVDNVSAEAGEDKE